LKVTVCEFSEDPQQLALDWEKLVRHVSNNRSQLVLLPEMPFYSWFPRRRGFEPGTWKTALDAHDTWEARLAELAPAAVLGSRPVEQEGRRLNQAFCWSAQEGYQPIHAKYYLPDEAGFWEASWYQPGAEDFSPFRIDPLKIGFLICTELWFQERARAYGRQGVHLIACPRATQATTLDKWLVGGRAAAVVSGAYCLSSNRTSPPGTAYGLGGQGWTVDPDGEVMGLTSLREPCLTLEIGVERAESAKSTYPRYVRE
jgi:N-carbamoylputrescine amidase